jgi:hypothetical protein
MAKAPKRPNIGDVCLTGTSSSPQQSLYFSLISGFLGEKFAADWTPKRDLVGASLSSVISAGGPPSATYQLPGGHQSVVYTIIEHSGGYITPAQTDRCDIIFLVNQNQVIEQTRVEGNKCTHLMRRLGML